MAKRKPLVFVAGEIVEQKAGDTLEGNNIVVTASGSTEERPLKDRFADIVNVKDFGAKGDGETDDTLAFEKAVAEAARKGGVVYVPHGTYKVAEPVTGEFISFGHPTIVGEGSVTFLTDLYDDYVHKTKNVKEDITGDKTFVGKTDFKNDVVFHENTEFKKIPVSVTPETKDSSKKVPTTEWIHNLISGSDGLKFDPETGQLVINLSEMSPEDKSNLLDDLIAGGDTDGFKINSDGKLEVNPSEFMSAGGGLDTDSDGKLVVDFSNMPTDKFEALLKAANIPIYIDGTKVKGDFYVNGTTGVDENTDQARGRSASKPWKTIAYAVGQVTRFYNVNFQRVNIYVAAGTYNLTSSIALGDFTRTTGNITIRPLNNTDSSPNYKNISGYDNVSIVLDGAEAGGVFSCAGGRYYIKDMRLVRKTTNTMPSSTIYPYIVRSDGPSAYVTLSGCKLEFVDQTPSADSNNKIRLYCNSISNNAILKWERGTTLSGNRINAGWLRGWYINNATGALLGNEDQALSQFQITGSYETFAVLIAGASFLAEYNGNQYKPSFTTS